MKKLLTILAAVVTVFTLTVLVSILEAQAVPEGWTKPIPRTAFVIIEVIHLSDAGVIQELNEIQNVEEIYDITGDSVLAKVDTENYNELVKTVEKIRKIPGVESDDALVVKRE